MNVTAALIAHFWICKQPEKHHSAMPIFQSSWEIKMTVLLETDRQGRSSELTVVIAAREETFLL